MQTCSFSPFEFHLPPLLWRQKIIRKKIFRCNTYMAFMFHKFEMCSEILCLGSSRGSAYFLFAFLRAFRRRKYFNLLCCNSS